MFKKAPFFLFFLLLSVSLSAQTSPKYGHMNLGVLLELLPDTKTANDQLKVFADKLGITDDSLGRALQAGAEKLQKEYDSGVLTPVSYTHLDVYKRQAQKWWAKPRKKPPTQ